MKLYYYCIFKTINKWESIKYKEIPNKIGNLALKP